MSSRPSEARLVARGLTKRYGAVTALEDVSVEFLPGEVHAVLGENGAGKSTLMGVLAGFTVPNAGSVELDQRPLPLGDPHACRARGVEMVHQHFTLVPAFTVIENLALSSLPSLMQPLNLPRLAAEPLEQAKRLGWEVDPRARVSDLSVGVQQRIEIVKCLRRDASVLILDEPTAALSTEEVADLFRVLRGLRDEGRTVVLIAHKLKEVMAVADRVTVLRKGRFVASAPVSDVTEGRLAEWMVGEMPDLAARTGASAVDAGLSVRDLWAVGDRGVPAVRGVSFDVPAGTIVGIGGVDGNGQIELAEVLAAIRPCSRGELLWKDRPIGTGRLAVAYIPQDRQEDGLALTLSVSDNLLIAGHRREELSWGPFLVERRVWEWVRALIERFGILVRHPSTPVSQLSGGNQQKVVVARALERPPELLVAVNPTRGLDVRATRYVHDQIVAARAAGAAVALFSTDLDELAALSDRRLFMSRGELSSEQTAEALVG